MRAADAVRANPFSACHPAVGFAYLASAILLSMAAFHPVYAAISLAGGLAASGVFRGARATARSLAWVAPMAALIAVLNMVFTPAGSTALFSAFGRAFYLEALCYGATAGAVFAAMMLWFMSYAAAMDSEATAALMGRAFPLVSLMASQVMRLVPQFVRRGRDVGAVQSCTSAAAPRGRADALAGRLRSLTVLLGWGMEDGIVRGDAMRARGYGCGRARTRYRRQRFGARDGAAVAAILALAAVNGLLAWVACSQFGFYPYMDTLVAWWGYLPYAAFACVPPALSAGEAIAWR